VTLLHDLNDPKPTEPCRAITLALELEADDARILLDAYDNPRWTATALSKALRARGITLGKDTIRAHREKTCKCLKS